MSLGYLTPSAARVTAGPWLVSSGGGHALSEVNDLPNWDYFTPVRVERELAVDLAGARRDCDLGEETAIRGVMTWHSTLTNLRGASETSIDDGAATLSLDLDPTQLGGTITVQSKLVLMTSLEGSSSLAPHRAGSVLWSDEIRITLEGQGQRFPILPIDFVKAGLAGGRESSGWCLEGAGPDADLSSSGTGSLRLLVNTANPATRSVLEDPGSHASAELRRFLHYDVTRQLFTAALENEDLVDEMDYEAGTLGDLLKVLTRRVFGARKLETLRGEFKQRPSELEAELQARLRFLDQPP